jgi:hypothetical protein
MLSVKEKTLNQKISDKIRYAMVGRTQRWLSDQTLIPEDRLSNKMRSRTKWTQEDLDKINKVLNTDFKL